MKKSKAQQLQAVGWRIGETKDFLNLSDEEVALIEMRLSLADSLKHRRQSLGLSQQDVAKQIGSSQSRVAKMENADESVSIDLLVRSLLSLGTSRQDIGRIIGKKPSTPAA